MSAVAVFLQAAAMPLGLTTALAATFAAVCAAVFAVLAGMYARKRAAERKKMQKDVYVTKNDKLNDCCEIKASDKASREDLTRGTDEREN